MLCQCIDKLAIGYDLIIIHFKKYQSLNKVWCNIAIVAGTFTIFHFVSFYLRPLQKTVCGTVYQAVYRELK